VRQVHSDGVIGSGGRILTQPLAMDAGVGSVGAKQRLGFISPPLGAPVTGTSASQARPLPKIHLP